MSSDFPLKPYINSVKQDNTVMRYVNGGDFAKSEIGATPQGLPKDIMTERMSIVHVGGKK